MEQCDAYTDTYNRIDGVQRCIHLHRETGRRVGHQGKGDYTGTDPHIQHCCKEIHPPKPVKKASHAPPPGVSYQRNRAERQRSHSRSDIDRFKAREGFPGFPEKNPGEGHHYHRGSNQNHPQRGTALRWADAGKEHAHRRQGAEAHRSRRHPLPEKEHADGNDNDG